MNLRRSITALLALFPSTYGERRYRVLVVGSTGTGKSTLINALAGSEYMETSAAAKGCTAEYQSISVSRGLDIYQFIDTVGINEPTKTGTVDSIKAMKMFVNFLRDNRDGFNLVILTQLKGRITQETKRTYELMVQKLFSLQDKTPPVLLVVNGEFTGYEMEPQVWCEENRQSFIENGFHEAEDRKNLRCLYLPPKSQLPSREKENNEIRLKSTADAWKIVETMISDEKVPLWTDFGYFTRMFHIIYNTLAAWFGWEPKIPEYLETFLRGLGVSKDDYWSAMQDL